MTFLLAAAEPLFDAPGLKVVDEHWNGGVGGCHGCRNEAKRRLVVEA